MSVRCEDCGQDMIDGGSCRIIFDDIAGHAYPRIPYGDEQWMRDEGFTPDPECGDCGVRIGGYHHPACDQAVCPRCGTQVLTDFECQALDAGWVAPVVMSRQSSTHYQRPRPH